MLEKPASQAIYSDVSKSGYSGSESSGFVAGVSLLGSALLSLSLYASVRVISQAVPGHV